MIFFFVFLSTFNGEFFTEKPFFSRLNFFNGESGFSFLRGKSGNRVIFFYVFTLSFNFLILYTPFVVLVLSLGSCLHSLSRLPFFVPCFCSLSWLTVLLSCFSSLAWLPTFVSFLGSLSLFPTLVLHLGSLP